MRNLRRFCEKHHGFTLIELMIVIAIIGILAGAAVVTLRATQIQGHETATIKALDTISVVELQYYNTHNRNYATFDQMVKERLLDSRFAAGNPPTVDGYVLTLTVTPKAANQEAGFALNADPQQDSGVGATGRNHYFIDQSSGSKHINDARPAGPNDPPPRWLIFL